MSLLGNITQSFTPKYSQGIDWRNKFTSVTPENSWGINCGNPSGPNGSGPVLRDTARLSQRYPHIARYGVLVSQHSQLGAIPPPPFSQRLPLGEHAKWRCDTPPQKGYLSDTCAIPHENKANGCDTPLCDTISKKYCAIWGVSRIGPLSKLSLVRKLSFIPHYSQN